MAFDLLNVIGNTPLVEIKRLNPNPQVRILAKLEYLNPGGSIKDRAARAMIEAGERSGALKPGMTVIEATSGNTGIGLALVCAIKGYKLLLTMSEAASLERRQILQARGAEILLTPGHLGTDGAIEEVYRLARENPDRFFMADQYNTEANWLAHYHGTAQEIWQQANGAISKVVATMGTTGTLMGLSRRLKELDPSIEIIGVEPYLGHKIQGLKNMKEAYCPEIYDKRLLDQKVNIEDELAFEMTRQLAKVEGIFVGMSSGAAMAVAVQEARSMPEGTIVAVFPDGGERYLSTPLFAVQEKIELKLFNQLSRNKEAFTPITPAKVNLYTCGPTMHARMHLGECRRMVFADLLGRYLRYRGYEVNHIINLTDLDDKTIQGSEDAGLSLKAFTDGYIQSFHEDMSILGVYPADAYPRASEHINEMVALGDKLEQKGFAYEKLRSLYFNLGRMADYGRLSGVDINKIKLGATVDLDEYEKDNPRDFTLFKRSKLSELKKGLYTKTKWGNVRPSWHIQSVAMAMKYLGPSFDIHSSSREFAFPHHENELAIAQAVTGQPLARYWVHCERVLMDGKRVDEKGAGLTLADLQASADDANKVTNRQIRFWLLSTHYRKPIIFTVERLQDAARSIRRLDACIHGLTSVAKGEPYQDLDQLLYDIRHGFKSAMDDDLNISAALASIFKTIKRVNRLLGEQRIDPHGAVQVIEAFREIDSTLQIFAFDDEPFDAEVQHLLKERRQARLVQDWQKADALREQLQARGITLRDNKIAGRSS